MNNYKNCLKAWIRKELFFLGLILEIFLVMILFLRERMTSELTQLPSTSEFMIILVLLTMSFLIYVYGAKRWEAGLDKIVIIFSFLFIFTLFFVKPIRSSDVFTYISTGRIISIHEQNPYLIPYSSFDQDIFHGQITGVTTTHTSLYGPVFNTISSLVVFLSDSLVINFYTFKFINVLLFFFSGFLIYKITDNIKSFYFFAWNPFLLFMILIDTHNELFWIAPVLLGLFLLKKIEASSKLSSYTLLLISLFMKFFSAVLLPLWLIYQVNAKSVVERLKRYFFYLLLTILVGMISFSYYWEGTEIFLSLLDLGTINSPLASPLILTIIFIPRIFGFVISTANAQIFGQLLFLLILVWRIIVLQKDKRYEIFLREIVIVITTFFLTSLSWFMPWYLLAPIILLIVYIGVAEKKHLDKHLYALTAYGIVYSLVVA